MYITIKDQIILNQVSSFNRFRSIHIKSENFINGRTKRRTIANWRANANSTKWRSFGGWDNSGTAATTPTATVFYLFIYFTILVDLGRGDPSRHRIKCVRDFLHVFLHMDLPALSHQMEWADHRCGHHSDFHLTFRHSPMVRPTRTFHHSLTIHLLNIGVSSISAIGFCFGCPFGFSNNF